MKDQNPPPAATQSPNLTVVGANDQPSVQGSTALERYANATFDEHALLARATAEANAGERGLTAVWSLTTRSRNLTDAMDEWLQRAVMPLRAPALASLNAEAAAIKIDGRFSGVLLQSELDRIECKRQDGVQQELNRFNGRYHGLLNRARNAEQEYASMRANLARDAQTPNRLLELLIILAILLPEAWINLDSFRRAPMVQSDAMAWGLTIVVGAAIAIAAFQIGLFIRGLDYFLRPLGGRKMSGVPLIGIGLILLAVGLAAVAYARYYYLLPIIEQKIALGEEVPNMVIFIGGLLLGNLLCFLLGAAVTFLLHDENPEYAKVARQHRTLDKKIEGLRKRLQRRLDPIEARAAVERDELVRKERQMHNLSGYQKLQEHLAQFLAKDAEAVGILNNYRSRLIAENEDQTFARRSLTADLSDPMTRFTARQYSAEPIALHLA